MAFTKKGKQYLEFRKKMLLEQPSYHATLGIILNRNKRTEDTRYVDPKEAEKRIDEALKWL